jgi:hypothetical protein
MASIQLKPNEWPDVLMAYLFDKILHPDEISSKNEMFNKFMIKMKSRGFSPLLRDYYLTMDPNLRVKYKLIKEVFEETTAATAVIHVRPERFDKAKEKEEDGLIKKVLKKLLSSMEFTEDEKTYLTEVLNG